MKIWLARHGETAPNIAKQFVGKGNPGLLPKGRKSAQKIGRFLKRKTGGSAVIYSSPLARARQTAKIIALSLNCKNVLIEKSLREQDFGLWEKKTRQQVEARWPGSIAAWLKDQFKVTPEKGENYFDLEKRLMPFAKKIKSLPCENVVIVSHANIRRVLAKILLRLSKKQTLRVSKNYDAIILIEPNKCKMKTFKA